MHVSDAPTQVLIMLQLQLLRDVLCANACERCPNAGAKFAASHMLCGIKHKALCLSKASGQDTTSPKILGAGALSAMPPRASQSLSCLRL